MTAIHIRDQGTRVHTYTFHLMRTNCVPYMQPERGVVITAPPTVHYSEQILYAAILYYDVQATVSVIRNLEVVRYSGVSIVCIIYMYGDCSWCMQQCPLFGRRPLLGVSVNRESIVYYYVYSYRSSQHYSNVSRLVCILYIPA